MPENKVRFERKIQIIERAEKMGIVSKRDDRIDRILDLDNADKQFNLRLDDFLDADDENFAHDWIGIHNHMNRETGKCEDYFVPRFAGRSNAE